MAKSLFGKNPDMEDVEFVQTIEASFGIRFDHKEPETWTTFGNVFDATCQHVGPTERGSIPCLSASAYRCIKSAILKDKQSLEIRPGTPLKDLVGGRGLSDEWRRLEQETGLRLPGLPLSPWVLLLFPLSLFGGVGINHIVHGGVWIVVLTAILGVIAIRLLPPTLPARTVGDLARSVAALNAQELSQSYGAMRTRDVWDSLVWIARDTTGHKGSINRETVLIG